MITMTVEYFGDKPYEFEDDKGIVQRGVTPHYLDRDEYKLEKIPGSVDIPEDVRPGDTIILTGTTYPAKALARSGNHYDATCIMWSDCRKAEASLKAAM